VGQLDVEALSSLLDDAALEPVRPPLGMRGEDQLVRPERPDRIRDRLDRVGVTDLPVRLKAGRAHRSQARIEPHLRRSPRVVLVGNPVPKRRVERRGNNVNASPTTGAPPDLGQQLRPSDGLVRDDENAVLVRLVGRCGLLHRLFALPAA
jgi:hypothetical protein